MFWTVQQELSDVQERWSSYLETGFFGVVDGLYSCSNKKSLQMLLDGHSAARAAERLRLSGSNQLSRWMRESIGNCVNRPERALQNRQANVWSVRVLSLRSMLMFMPDG